MQCTSKNLLCAVMNLAHCAGCALAAAVLHSSYKMQLLHSAVSQCAGCSAVTPVHHDAVLYACTSSIKPRRQLGHASIHVAVQPVQLLIGAHIVLHSPAYCPLGCLHSCE
jgi:hypothetical protein